MSYFSKGDALLMLEDGTSFNGKAVGVQGVTVGEVVFNTAMTGYQEIMTDPSYASQIITFTYPEIGNTGVNNHDNESGNVWTSGIIVRDFVADSSNHRTEKSFKSFLQQNNVIAILLTIVAELVNSLTLPLSITEKYRVIGKRIIAETFIK
mgnify:CR=1 FL=1